MTFDSFETGGLATRRLRYAIAASLFAHLLIFWPGSLRVLTKDTPALLQATLRMLPTPLADPAPARPVPARPAPRAAPPALPVSPAIHAGPVVPERPEPSPVPQALALPAAPASKPAPESQPVAAAAATSVRATGMAGSSLMTEASATGDAADGLRGYRLALAVQARRFKRYPAQAMASGWAGSAEIRIEIGSDGRPRAATLVRSSGHELLDRAALAMIDAGALRARLPESLRDRAFAVVLPVVFSLEEE